MKLNEIKRMPLYESYKETLSVDLDGVVNLIMEHCSDALQSLDEPIVRGMNETEDFLQMHGESGERRSRNTDNYYTVIMDEVMAPGIPRRSKSIICGNYENMPHAQTYGALYAILPYNGVHVGYTDVDDMFDTPITIAGITEKAIRWNTRFKWMGIRDTSYADIVEDLTKYRDSDVVPDPPYQSWVEKVEDFDRTLRRAYDEAFAYSTTKDPRWNDGEPRELWIGGKCIAIKWHEWQDVKNRLRERMATS